MYNSYICISFMSYKFTPDWNSGRVVYTNKAAGIDLHKDIPYKQAKKLVARLMARTGKMPDIIPGKISNMYMISTFID